MPRAKTTTLVLSTILGLMLTLPAQAQYPERPIRFVVGFPPGGLTDTVARIFGDKMSAILGATITVDNRPGANGKMAEESVANSESNGYSVMIGDVSRPTLMATVNPGVPDLDFLKSFAFIGELGSTPMIMTISATLGVKDFPSLVAKLKAEKGKNFSYASIGAGSPPSVISAMLIRQLGLDVTMVPYRGGGEGLQAVAAGDVLWLVGTTLPALPLIQSGKIVPVFVVDRKRLKQLPDVPTLEELGYPQIRDERAVMFAMVPAGTPQPILQKLNAAVIQAQKDPEVRERLEKLGVVQPRENMTVDEARATAARQIEAWENAAKMATGR